MDEYQFMNKNNITAGVPNSEHKGEKTMSLNFKDENVVPASKRVNSEFYSKLMAEHGKSTKPIAANFDAIEAFCIGKTIAEVEDVANKSNIKAMDAVSGATLVDTKGYLSAVVAAAKNAK
ncbi:hypothetical protein FUT79_08920 [Treponema phagedenis]|uniref:hypothetical protein n=1 Tax=Treponema phagedenis TaxID=162 RepID=UPI0011E77E8E|nr:hypothetical protein [Treponema phagedenis]QEJ95310.1 hypothetical protein FUT79_08920 [Treponema phagedenis]QKS92545.1 hypothetical protein HPJ96_08310 [Treponema phagedenis]